MASDREIREGLKARMETIPGVTGYTRVPGQVNVPAAIVQRRVTRYDSTMARGSDDFEYVVTVVVSWADTTVAQDAMSAYLDTADDRSVKAAIEGDQDLGGVVHFARVREAGEELVRTYGNGGAEYLTVDFMIEITA